MQKLWELLGCLVQVDYGWSSKLSFNKFNTNKPADDEKKKLFREAANFTTRWDLISLSYLMQKGKKMAVLVSTHSLFQNINLLIIRLNRINNFC